ncbi:MAG TPA: dTMP kinase [Candidatus Diapherotrites archaeon]|uniref:Probable thymidylate kinase n=1 Tax=Candidatus Iainarchaeum sp. TaxID=3101447 RepID=A0A7J4IZL6_9ARCH|nr:dTMP kinase [Candidatus Diapherotrites archaeon]
MKGLFVVFDGVDGAGKGTAICEVEKFLLEKGISQNRILPTAEPGGGFYGKKLRELLRSKVDPSVNALQFLDLYVADRLEHVEKVISPALAEGKIILCDRYKYSTFVYQRLQGIPLGKIRELHKGLPAPDIAFILDVPVDIALERIGADRKRKYIESFEKKEFLKKVRGGFLGLRGIFPLENIVFVDASKSAQEVCKQVCNLIWERINKI